MKGEKAEPLPGVENSTEEDLPVGWELVNFSDYVDFQEGPGIMAIDFTESGIPLLRLVNIHKKTVDLTGCNFLSPEKVEKKWVHFRLKNQDILISSSASIGVVSEVTEESAGSIAYTGIIRLRPKRDQLDRQFLKIFVCSSRYSQQIEKLKTGITIHHYGPTHLKQVKILLPPLPEQQRIVARVDALLTHVNAAREPLSRVPLIMKKFRQVVLAAACSGRLTEGWRDDYLEVESAEKTLEHLRKEQKIKNFQKNYDFDVDSDNNLPANWCYVILDRLIEFNRSIGYGVLKPGDYDPNGIRLIKSGQVRDGFMDLSEIYRITPELDRKYPRTRLQGGEILLNLVGASIGRSAISPSELSGSNVSRAIAVIPVVKSCAEYVQLNLQGPLGQQLIQSKTGGTAQPVLNLEEVRSLLIPLPPLAEQHEIVRRVGLLFERADAFDREVAAAGRRCERLTQAVLGKAFAGKL